MRNASRLPCLWAVGLLITALLACGREGAPATPVAGEAIAADLSDAHCTAIAAGQRASYEAAHDQFTGPPELVPLFTKGQLFRNNDEIRFKWADAGKRALGIRVTLLRACSEPMLHDSALYVVSPGSDEVSTPLYTGSTAGRYPPGTPALVQVTTATIDARKMISTTTVIAQYTIRVEGPRR